MILTPLWHTEFLLDIENKDGKNIRFLIDSWFSDFVTWDLCERAVKVHFDHEKISSIDAIYISHAHTDHLDPYSLLQIYKNVNPVLLLPITLSYLIPLFREYIPHIQIQILKNREIFSFQGIDVMGIFFENEEITNEDDVMTISFASDREILFAEIDTIPPETLEAYKILNKLFTRKPYETIAYIASRNELEGNIKVLDAQTVKDRVNIKREYLHGRKEEIEWGYAKWEYEEYAEFPNFFHLDGFVRWYIGQGLMYPSFLSKELSELSLFPLSEVVDREVQIAATYDFHFPQKALLPGRQFRIEKGDIETGRKECPIWELSFSREQTPVEIEVFKRFSHWPLFPREVPLGSDDIQKKILEVLNHRLLPYFSASPVASLRSVLIKNPDWAYRIEFKIQDQPSLLFEYSLASERFFEVPFDANLHIDEDYWLTDILDYLSGRQELYSQFWHTLHPKRAYRLWMCLGANFLNNDLVKEKYRFHFERAKKWNTSEDFFREMIQSVKL